MKLTKIFSYLDIFKFSKNTTTKYRKKKKIKKNKKLTKRIYKMHGGWGEPIILSPQIMKGGWGGSYNTI